MTAPTTRETADHAELARAIGRLLPITCRDTPDYAEVSFGECQAQAMTMEPDTWLALNQLPALLSEIAALRGEVETLMTSGIIEVAVRNPSVADYVQHWEGRTAQAERQRDEARDTIASTVAKADWMQGRLSGERSSVDRETIELVVSECRAYCHLQDLANQGADQ